MKRYIEYTSFNLCVCSPENYTHIQGISELVELVKFSMQEIGLNVAINTNKLSYDEDCINVIFGAHLLSEELISLLPNNIVIFNTEQISNNYSSQWISRILKLSERFQIWDYSFKNIEEFIRFGSINVKIFQIGYQKELDRIIPAKEKDIDLLFYGSLNENRKNVLEVLVNRGYKIKYLFDVYGTERDQYIARSKLVLNSHFYPTQIFEIVRAFYLATNNIPFISEINQQTSIDTWWKLITYGAPYEMLAQKCINLIEDQDLLKEVSLHSYNMFKKRPQAALTQKFLETNLHVSY